jgi:predicted component of type VI protein secretion system
LPVATTQVERIDGSIEPRDNALARLDDLAMPHVILLIDRAVNPPAPKDRESGNVLIRAHRLK